MQCQRSLWLRQPVVRNWKAAGNYLCRYTKEEGTASAVTWDGTWLAWLKFFCNSNTNRIISVHIPISPQFLFWKHFAIMDCIIIPYQQRVSLNVPKLDKFKTKTKATTLLNLFLTFCTLAEAPFLMLQLESNLVNITECLWWYFPNHYLWTIFVVQNFH